MHRNVNKIDLCDWLWVKHYTNFCSYCDVMWCFCGRFLLALGRHNYITPTSYLELIGAFKTLITQKQESTMKAKRRYIIGLEKLAFAASQVTAYTFHKTQLPSWHLHQVHVVLFIDLTWASYFSMMDFAYDRIIFWSSRAKNHACRSTFLTFVFAVLATRWQRCRRS